MSRKGISTEEKKARMLQLFYERKEFFQLKDLEKIAPKEKGIIVNSVKDVLQSLVDDGAVDTDKIGTSIYFWAFPSKALNSKKRKANELEDQLAEANKKLKLTVDSITELKSGCDNSRERNGYLDEIMELEIQKKVLDKDMEKYADCNPITLRRMQEQTTKLKEAANRWTDNVFNVKSWCKRKFNMEDQELDKQFGIPADFDYVD
ncbi:meiotic nuclear division protein 1 homolog isoform X2 [Photinus pyralis]|nr:meiotic nuclear division protein 1 homolog isoform X2 [Photinus pyralis]XP_031354722.1 meiotic nuclear division protein 1 homolog isoform X2 [Photinus pyralis]